MLATHGPKAVEIEWKRIKEDMAMGQVSHIGAITDFIAGLHTIHALVFDSHHTVDQSPEEAFLLAV